MSNSHLEYFYNQLNPEEFRRMLDAVNFNNDKLFFELYENAPEHLMPDLKEDTYFTDKLCNRIEGFEENKFNEWFFEKDFKRFYNPYEVRTLIEKKKSNQKLKDHLEEIDKPQNIEEILSLLFYIRKKDEEKYHKIIKENQKKLLSLNKKIYTPKSYISEYFFSKIRDFSTSEKFILEKELGIDLIKIASRSFRNLGIQIQDISFENFKDFWERLPGQDLNNKLYQFDKYIFEYKNHGTDLFNKVFDAASNIQDPERLEKSLFLFQKVKEYYQQKHKIDAGEFDKSMNALLDHPDSEDLENFLNNFNSKTFNHVSMIKNIKEKSEAIFYCVNPLYAKLTQTIEEKQGKKSLKI